MSISEKRQQFIKGLKAGLPLAIGYIPVAVAYGLVSISSGLSVSATVAMSFLVFAGASQFIAVNLLAAGSTPLEIMFTTFVLNSRHFVMSSSLSQRLPKNLSKGLLALISFGITDESFALEMFLDEETLDPHFALGVNVLGYFSWVGASLAGALAGGFIPDFLQDAMGVCLYAMFIGLLVPNLKNSRPYLIAAAAAGAVSTILYLLSVPTGLSVIITAVLVSAAAAVFKEEA